MVAGVKINCVNKTIIPWRMTTELIFRLEILVTFFCIARVKPRTLLYYFNAVVMIR